MHVGDEKHEAVGRRSGLGRRGRRVPLQILPGLEPCVRQLARERLRIERRAEVHDTQSPLQEGVRHGRENEIGVRLAAESE